MMMEQTLYEIKDSVAVITLNNPPVNGLGLALRTSIVKNVMQAQADASVHAIIITGSEKAFSGGADIKEFGTAKSTTEPHLGTVISTIENSTKPVVAVIQGTCMGGGFELALGCHYRIAHPKANLALPEVKLGLLPGAGGTQRLPRVVGVEHALNFIVSGEALPAMMFKDSALIDAYFEDQVLEQSIAFAKQLVADKKPLKKIRDIKVDYPNYQGYLQFTRNTLKTVAGPYPAPLKIVDCIEAAASLPFDKGIAVEREKFMELMNTPESRAMRYAFFASRNTAKINDIPSDTPIKKIEKVGVIGAGTMGGGIAMNFANAGIPVIILETEQAKLDKGLATISGNYANTVKKGKLKQEVMDKRMSMLSTTLSYDDLKDVDLVIEAVFEELGVKEVVFKKLDEVVKQGAILASNTSTLDIDKIAGFTKRPQDVIGLHFFSPANVMQLLEVVRGEKTSNEVLATSMKIAQTIKKTPVVSRVCDGFIGNRMIEQYSRMAGFLLEQGATPAQVDKALESWGMIMGPFRMGDLAGNDIGWAIRKRRSLERPNMNYSRFADVICEAGRYGQKTNKGWYLYEPGSRKAIPDPQLDEMLVKYRAEKGVTPRKISNEEIVQSCIFALVNEAARLLEEGIAQRGSDIDVVYLTGYGFPFYRGGPLKYADEVGLFNVIQTCEKFYAQTGDEFWKPAKRLQDCLASGKAISES
jgi:3-hydroxyacyl-CoA dehydrogenase